MIQVNLTDGSGKWFDYDQAIAVADVASSNNNPNSVHTTSGKYQNLYVTRLSNLVIQEFDSATQQSTYVQIDASAATAWITANNDTPLLALYNNLSAYRATLGLVPATDEI